MPHKIPIYHLENGHCYILADDRAAGHEKQNLKMAIALAQAEMEHIMAGMLVVDIDSAVHDQLQDGLTAHEMMISDFEDRIAVLEHRPKP